MTLEWMNEGMVQNILLILLTDRTLLKITEKYVYTCMHVLTDVDKLTGLE